MSLTFYYSPQSSATPVHWALEELGIPYEKVLINIRNGDQNKPEFLKLNPNGRVPLIVHDGVAIFESVAIQIYLGETFGVAKGLYPAPGPQRGEALKWLVWTNVTLGDAIGRVGRHLKGWSPEDERNAKAGESAKTEAANLLGMVEAALADRDYLVGNKFSLADLHLAAWMDYARMMDIDLAPFPKLLAWVERCTARPACKTGD